MKNNKELTPDWDKEFMVVYKDGSSRIEEFVSEEKAREFYLSNPHNSMPNFDVSREMDEDIDYW